MSQGMYGSRGRTGERSVGIGLELERRRQSWNEYQGVELEGDFGRSIKTESVELKEDRYESGEIFGMVEQRDSKEWS